MSTTPDVSASGVSGRALLLRWVIAGIVLWRVLARGESSALLAA
jgi:hypothetical protein